MGRKTVIGQGFPIGKQHAPQVRCKEGHFVLETLRIGGVCRDDRYPL